MFNALKTAIVNNQDTIVRKSLGLGSIAVGLTINSLLNQPKGPKNVVIVEEQTIIVEETVESENTPDTEETK